MIPEKLKRFANSDNLTSGGITKIQTSVKLLQTLDVDAWIAQHGVTLTGRNKESSGDRYIGVNCPNNSSHMEAAIIIKSDGTIGYHCFHNSCADWDWKKYRGYYEPAYVRAQEVNESEDDEDNEEQKRLSQADILVKLMKEYTDEIFTNEIGETFARFNVKGVLQTHLVRGSVFKSYLTGLYYRSTEKAPSSEAIRQAVGVAGSIALFDGATRKTYLRCANMGESIVYDLADDAWQSIIINADGWEITDTPIGMIRAANTSLQVIPERGGNIDLLRPFLNTRSEVDFILVVVWLTYCIMCPDLPKPLICLHGSKGSGKSTFQRILRKIQDPAAAELSSMPKTKEAIALQADRNYCLAFDNLSNISDEQSDFLCIVATGGALPKRKLYTDNEEVILRFCKPITLSGINSVAERSDLLDRSLMIELARIPQTARRSERKLWADFEKVKPKILGALFDAIAISLKMPDIDLPELERMADFTELGYKLAVALGFNGETFMAALSSNTEKTLDSALKASPVAICLMDLLENEYSFDGSSSMLHKRLNEVAYKLRLGRVFPQSTTALTKALRPMVTDLQAIGVVIEESRVKHLNQTFYHIERKVMPHSTSLASHTSQSNENDDLVCEVKCEINNLFTSQLASQPQTSIDASCESCEASEIENDINLWEGEF